MRSKMSDIPDGPVNVPFQCVNSPLTNSAVTADSFPPLVEDDLESTTSLYSLRILTKEEADGADADDISRIGYCTAYWTVFRGEGNEGQNENKSYPGIRF